MRFLLSHKLPYSENYAGATRTVRTIVKMLSARGHEIVVVCRDQFSEKGPSAHRSPPDLSGALTVDQDARVYALPNHINFEKSLDHVIDIWNPDCALIGEDPTYLSLEVVIGKSVERIVLVAQSQATLPFGPEAFYPDQARTKLLQPPVEIAVFSHYMSEYIKRWGRFDSTLLPPLPCRQLNAPLLGHHENPYIMFVNASKIKGLPIFTQLAQRFPSTRFAAVLGWATTSDDISELSHHANVTVLQPKHDISEIFAQARLLLVPSLWGEAFGYVALEAMAYGIPVLASNVGGLPEAKLGVDYVIPVNPIRTYSEALDDRLLPEPMIPKQNMEPWFEALQLLINDREQYNELSRNSRSVAMRYLENLEESAWMQYLEGD